MNIKLKKAISISQQILLGFVDANLFLLELFDSRKIYRVPLKTYDNFRLENKQRFGQEIYRLEQDGFIKKYFNGKETYLELSTKGKKRLKKHITDQIEINKPKKWDKKWHIVIFDIPNQKTDKRNVLRNKLIEIGFLELQESVYIYPFNCLEEINLIKNMYYVEQYVQYIIADRIETEIDLIKEFINNKVLTNKMIN